MDCYEYMRIPAKYIPANIMEQYNLAPLVHNGHVLTEIQKGMYGLPQAGILAYNRLVTHLALSGYTPVQHTPGLFRHATRPVTFSLVVDNFAIKYVDRANAEHLLATLRSLNNITTDWTASMYCGITLKWDYVARTVDLSMPGYIEKALEAYLAERPKRPQHAPHAWTAPSYGSKVQLTPPADNSEPLDAGGLTRIQRIISTLLFYGRAIDSTLLVALGTLSAAQSKGTAATAQAITQLLNYCATYPDATIRFIASEMHLHIHSDTSYLSEIRAHSRAGGYFFLSNKPKKLPPEPHDTPPPLNGAIHVHSSIMRSVLSSATEAETGALFQNAKDERLSVSHCSNSDTLKNPRQYRLTMRAHRASSMTPSSNAAPKPWTCDFIGSRTASPKTNTSSIGAKAATTSLTTSPSIIPRLTIASCARGIWSTYTDQLLCKGVLNLPRNHFRVTLRSRPQTSRIA